MSKGSRTDLCGGWPERAIPTATGWWPGVYWPSSGCDHRTIEASSDRGVTEMRVNPRICPPTSWRTWLSSRSYLAGNRADLRIITEFD